MFRGMICEDFSDPFDDDDQTRCYDENKKESHLVLVYTGLNEDGTRWGRLKARCERCRSCFSGCGWMLARVILIAAILSIVVYLWIASLTAGCPGGKHWAECSTSCVRTCVSPYIDLGDPCRDTCETRCQCPPAYPVWHNRRCVAVETCNNHSLIFE